VDDIAAWPGVEVRRMREEDVEAVVDIETGAFSSPWSRETFINLIDRPGLELMVVEDRAEGIVGYAVLWCILDQGELANVAITPRLRGKGLGRLLMTRVIEVARTRGVEALYLEVRVSNAPAADLYQSLGFTEVGVRKGYYDDPKEDARIMMARL
jgi:[ribosomal protein S18]-alanine N-acetyltransferase